jgi:hypothetical protein
MWEKEDVGLFFISLVLLSSLYDSHKMNAEWGGRVCLFVPAFIFKVIKRMSVKCGTGFQRVEFDFDPFCSIVTTAAGLTYPNLWHTFISRYDRFATKLGLPSTFRFNKCLQMAPLCSFITESYMEN